jgi:hypothetical protein
MASALTVDENPAEARSSRHFPSNSGSRLPDERAYLLAALLKAAADKQLMSGCEDMGLLLPHQVQER